MGGAWSACELHPPQTSPVVTMPYTALGHQMRRSASSSAMTLSITAPSLSTPMVRPPSAVGEVRDVDRTHQPWAACDPRAHQPWVPCDPRAHQPWAPCDHHLAGRSVQPWGGTGYALLLSAAADDSGDLFASEVSAFSCARTHTYTYTCTYHAHTPHTTHQAPTTTTTTKHPATSPPQCMHALLDATGFDLTGCMHRATLWRRRAVSAQGVNGTSLVLVQPRNEPRKNGSPGANNPLNARRGSPTRPR